ncbi:MAG: ATP-binding protein, partial [Pseudomonadota bacterium]
SNHIVMPIALRFLDRRQQVSGDVRNLLLNARRISIALILALGFFYFQLSGGSDALAAIGLIAFAGVAQFLPSLLGGIFWRGATRAGALAGLMVGALLWAYTLFLPSFGGDLLLSREVLTNGPWGIELLRPQALLGLGGFDPLVHALIWSVGANTLVFMIISVLSDANPLERLQSAQFVDIFRAAQGANPPFETGSARSEDLFILAQRILGAEPARRLFDEIGRIQGRATGLPLPTPAMMARLERELAGSVGAPSAHAMVARVAGQADIGVPELIDIADETQRLMETSRQLTDKSAELERAAHELREANARLRTLDAQKDDFLSQVSHELRTPMTSIRSFAEILQEEDIQSNDRQRFTGIIHEESQRLTRLLDEILDISRLEAGTLDLPVGPIDASETISAAIDTVGGMTRARGIAVTADAPPGLTVHGNADRLRQVLINLLSNAVKYNTAPEPKIRVVTAESDQGLTIDVIDNGGGVSREELTSVFDKFTRGLRADQDQGAGLGLPISRAIMRTMGGDLTIEFADDQTSFFRASLPRAA